MRHSPAASHRLATPAINTGNRAFVDVRMVASVALDSDWDNWDYNPFSDLNQLSNTAHELASEEANDKEAGHAW